jgi:hypothetical protein
MRLGSVGGNLAVFTVHYPLIVWKVSLRRRGCQILFIRFVLQCLLSLLILVAMLWVHQQNHRFLFATCSYLPKLESYKTDKLCPFFHKLGLISLLQVMARTQDRTSQLQTIQGKSID